MGKEAGADILASLSAAGDISPVCNLITAMRATSCRIGPSGLCRVFNVAVKQQTNFNF